MFVIRSSKKVQASVYDTDWIVFFVCQIEVLQAEVVALKQLVLTSTPASPNKHLHPQIAATMSTEKGEKPKSSKPFWKTHRRSTSHHEFTKEARQEVEAQQEAKADRCKEVRAKKKTQTYQGNSSENYLEGQGASYF